MAAVPRAPISLQVAPFRRSLLRLTASNGSDFPAAIAGMARGDYPTAHWTAKTSLAQLVERGIFPLRRQEHVKVLVDTTVRTGLPNV
jgi:hypothetical protein